MFCSVTNQYFVAAVTPDFLRGANWTVPTANQNQIALLQGLQRNASTYQRLEVEDCIRAYGVGFISDRRHLLLVTHNRTVDNSVIGTLNWTYNGLGTAWECGTNVTSAMNLVTEASCTTEAALQRLPLLAGGSHVVDFCLSQTVSDQCRLEFSIPVILIVIVCNIVILVGILMTLVKRQITLVTIGDALASFLEEPDATTPGMPATDVEDIKAGKWPDNPEPQRWSYRRYSRWRAYGLLSWIWTNAV
jgi:hypothetical protein